MPRLSSLLSVGIVLWTVSVAPVGLDAQSSAADSARAFETMPETAQVLELNRQAWALRRSDPALAIATAKRSLEFARRIGFRRAEAQVLNYLGVGYQWLGDNRQASDHFFAALAVAESAGSLVEQGYALNNIAAVLLAEGDGEGALGYAQRSLALQESTKDRRGIAYAEHRLAEIANRLSRHDEAIAAARRSLALWQELGETSTSLTARRDIAIAYEGKRQYASALAQLLAIDGSDSLPATTRQHNYTDLARLYVLLERPQEAIEVGLRRLRGSERDADILGHMSAAYALEEDWARAYSYAKRETAVRDSMATEERFRQLKALQIDYETTQKEQENDALRAGLRLTRWLAVAIGAILLLAAALLVSLLKGKRRQEAVHRTLAEQFARIQASEAALAESWRRQRAILENVPDAMWVKDVAGHYSTVNAAFCQRFGMRKEELEGRSAADILVADAEVVLADHEARVIASRQMIREEHEIVANGVPMLVERTISPVFDADDKVIGTTGISRDITDRRRAEVQLRHAQRLESVGVLAGGIAHDFNNLLVGILGNTELARLDLAPDAAARESLAQIEVAAHRAKELTRRMLDFTGKTQSDLRDLDVSAAIGRISAEMEAVVPAGATLQLALAPDLPTVSADAAQVAQIVLGLVTNAAEALPDGVGTITVRTELARISAAESAAAREPLAQDAPNALAEGEYVVIEVADTGHGMSAETRRRIFDPFFSTRFVGRGLSLAAVVGILRRHRGTIEVESVEGRGSRFRAYFPVARAAAEVVAVVPAVAPAPVPAPVPLEVPSTGATSSSGAASVTAPASGLGTILVVDDEPTVRTFARRVLERAKFAVVTAEDGDEGVAKARSHDTEIVAVLLDVMMPRMGGHEAARELRRLIPDLPIVIMSGFTGDAAITELCAEEGIEFLAKPFGADVLVRTIRGLIEERAKLVHADLA